MKTKMIMVCLLAAMSLVASAAKPAPKKARPGNQRQTRVVVTTTRPERRLAPGERRLLDAIEEADSMRELVRLLPAARQSPNPEIRLAMVSALEDQERRAVNELAYFIGDANREVSEAAFSAWSDVVEDFEHPSQRVTAICQAAQILQAAAPAVPVAVPVAQPVPVVQQPVAPVVQQPAPVVQQPVPVAQPAPVVQQPAPVVAPAVP